MSGGWHSTRHLAFSAGDLSWQGRDDAPPACRVPTGLPKVEELERHRLFDGGGPGKISGDGWARIRSAIEVCRSGCPVLEECLSYALQPRHRVEGVWGGAYFPTPGGGQERPLSASGLRVPVTPPPPGERTRYRKRRPAA